MKQRQRKHSIKLTIAGTFIGLLALALGLVWICNYFFLEAFYVNQKMEILKSAVYQLEQIEELGSAPDAFNQFCVRNNLMITVVNEDNTMVYSNLPDVQRDKMVGRLFGYITGVDQMEPHILEETDNYVIQENKDIQMQNNYVEIWGTMTDGKNYLIRTPLESIRDSVALSNRFSVYIGLCVILLGSLMIWIFTRRITRPITELTEISKKMAALDFEARYQSGGEDEIGVLGRNFNTMSEQLERTISELKSANNELQQDIRKKIEIDEMRKEFLSNVSHELKTPIALIQGYAEGLLDNINEDAESRDFYCEVIIDEAAKMNQMVKKLLSLNQLEFGNEQTVMTRFDIASLIRGVIQSARILTEQKGTEVIFCQSEPLYVWGDEFKVEEVVTNFFSNALNHVKYDNKIEVRCKQIGGLVRTSVFNTGDPIPEADLDKIWIKFYKVDKARTREYGGSGIGLSIVKAIMESMHQHCGVRNYENGVEFWFELEGKA